MAANYAKLWKLLIDKNINKTTLREISGIWLNWVRTITFLQKCSRKSVGHFSAMLEM